MRVHCPSCRAALDVRDAAMDRMVECPACGASFPALAGPPLVLSCPRCSARVERNDKFCSRCGLRMDSAGGPAPHETDGADEPGLLFHLVESLAALIPGLFRPWVLLAIVLLTLLAIGVILFSVFVITLGALIEGFFVAGFGLMIYGQAMALLVYGEMGLLHDILADLDARRVWLWLVLTLAPVAGFLLLLRIRPAPGT